MGKIIIAGGTGFLGTYLTQSLINKDHEVIILSRKPGKSESPKIKFAVWDGKTMAPWAKELENATAVINLSGKSINTRFTPKNKKALTSSRLNSTKVIGEAIQKCITPPKVWINASGTGIYGDGGNDQKNESSLPGKGFVAELCEKWEKELFKTETPQTRKIALRTSLVLSKGGGALKPLLLITRLGLGGKAGSGNQYLPWIHYKDWVKMVEWLCQEQSISGPVNIAAPQEVTNASFMAEMRKALKVPFGIPQPAIFVKIGAFLMGTDPSLILTGQRVEPEVPIKNNFNYNFPTLSSALKNLFMEN